MSTDTAPCEWCLRAPAVDVHHIDPRGMGGSQSKDYTENLMGLCRKHHDQAEAKLIPKEKLIKTHLERVNRHKHGNRNFILW